MSTKRSVGPAELFLPGSCDTNELRHASGQLSTTVTSRAPCRPERGSILRHAEKSGNRCYRIPHHEGHSTAPPEWRAPDVLPGSAPSGDLNGTTRTDPGS